MDSHDTNQHPFDDFDHVRPGRMSQDTHPSQGSVLVQEPASPLPTPTATSSTAANQRTVVPSSPPLASTSHNGFSNHRHLNPPMTPLQTTTSSLATSAAARFSQAFSPLLSARRKSTVIDEPSTPDTKGSHPYGNASSLQASPGSIYSANDGSSLTSHELLTVGNLHSTTSGGSHSSHFGSNFAKITSFSSPRSSTRTRKTLPPGISNVPEESGYPAFSTPPHTATAFHTGLAPHYGNSGSGSMHRESHHEPGQRDSGSRIGTVGGSSTVEKALKKAKVFLDDRAKPKARAASLWAFLDVTFEFDQAKFFQEHADQVFTVTHDSFWHQIDKFKQKPDRNNALQSKEVVAVQKTLLLLRLIFLYLPDRMKNGWHRRPIANMLAQVLCHKNHPRLRIFGFRLLLLWVNDQTVEYPEAVYLFSNAISLDLFMYDGEDLSIDHASTSQSRLPAISSGSSGRKSARQVSQYFELAYVNLNQELLQSDGPPICPNPSPPTFQDSIQLFQIFLANIVRMAYVAAGSSPPPGELESINSHHPLEADGDIGDGIAMGFGIDAGMAAARFMFDIIKKYYLVKVFPECARNLNLIKDEGKEFGYKTCPPTILRTIIGFIIQYCLDSNEFNSPMTHTSPATPILKSIVYSSEINREMMHEIVRQGLTLPPGHPQYKDIVRGAVHIVGVWCLSGDEERPAFLRKSSNRTSQKPTPERPSQQQDPVHEPYGTANLFLQRYFQLLTNVFYDHPVPYNDYGSNSSSDALGSTSGVGGAGGNYSAKLDPDALYSQYRDIIGLFRAIIARGQIEMDSKSWEVLLRSLLEIQRRVMIMPEKYSTPLAPSTADDLAAYIVETVLCAYSRCPNVSSKQWVELRKTMIDSLRWPQAVAQWARWTLRLTHLMSHEIFQVDVETQQVRPSQSAGSRHGRTMSDKFRHSRYLSSKTDSSLRHSIGGELLSSQGISYSHQTYPTGLGLVGGAGGGLGAERGDRSSRRANSVHYEVAKGSGINAASNTTMYAPTMLGHMGFLPSREITGLHSFHPVLKSEATEFDEEDMYDPMGSHISALGEAFESTEEKLSRASSLSFHGTDSLHIDPIVERLSSLYGIFSAPDFLNLSIKGRSPEQILSVWKNIACAVGNPNHIQIPLVKTEVMLCLIDMWDVLNQTRINQPLHATIIPPLYDFAPWFFEAAKSSNDGGIGLPAIYGGLCRMMSRRYDQDFDPEFYQMFYAAITQGLLVEDSMIGQSILANSSRLFTLSLPGSHALVLPFLSAIRKMLLKEGQLRDGVSHYIRKQAIAILCSVSMLFYDFKPAIEEHHPHRVAREGGATTTASPEPDLLPFKLTFTRLVLDLTVAEANVKPLGKFWDTHSMLIQVCGMLIVNEWGSRLETCDIGAESELLLLVLDHLYWTEASIVQSAVEVITTLAGLYQDHEDNGWLILEMVLSHLLSALQEHLRLFQTETKRGSMISSLFRCMTEWLMVIPTEIFSETELSKWVFDLIEIGLSASPDGADADRKKVVAAQSRQLHQQYQQYRQNQQQQQSAQGRQSKKRGPSFRFMSKGIHLHNRVMLNTGPTPDSEVERQIVKESAEATLVHLVHFLNNVPAMYGSDKILTAAVTEKGETRGYEGSEAHGSPQDKQRIFALNDSILITLEEMPQARQGAPRTRVTIRDETGQYAWDSEIFYKESLADENPAAKRGVQQQQQQRPGSRMSFGPGGLQKRRKKELASQLIWREGIQIKEDKEPKGFDVSGSNGQSSDGGSAGIAASAVGASMVNLFKDGEMPLWDGAGRGDVDMLDQLLNYIGAQHPDCLFDGKTPLNRLGNGMAISATAAAAGGPPGSRPGLSTGFGSSGGRPGSSASLRTIDVELDRHVQEETYYSRISDPQARAWYDKLVELRSSMIAEDEDVDEYSGSNTLMSLVNSNWVGLGEGSKNGEEDKPPGEKLARRLVPLESTKEGEGSKDSEGGVVAGENGQDEEWDLVQSLKESHLGDGPAVPTSSTSGTGTNTSGGRNIRRNRHSSLMKDDLCMAKAFQLAMPPEPERPTDQYQHSRLLLSHLGLLCFERFQEHNFVLLNPSASLERDLKSLDKRSGRETFKIAVLYVGSGQEGEQVILRNQKGSAQYDWFVHDLGWEVELESHQGYMGGLERNGSNGKTAIYYGSSTLEVIFHEVTRMPTDPDDPRQVKKKRHLGNDHVHIVWTEHHRAYDRNTIGGDFGNVLIVLSPIQSLDIEDGQIKVVSGDSFSTLSPSSLVSVEVIRDMNLPVFGPLVDGMVVPMSQLGRLVRQTAIHAARLASAPPPLPPTPALAGFGTSLGGVHHNRGSTVGGSGGIAAGGHQLVVVPPGSSLSSAMQGHQYHNVGSGSTGNVASGSNNNNNLVSNSFNAGGSAGASIGSIVSGTFGQGHQHRDTLGNNNNHSNSHTHHQQHHRHHGHSHSGGSASGSSASGSNGHLPAGGYADQQQQQLQQQHQQGHQSLGVASSAGNHPYQANNNSRTAVNTLYNYNNNTNQSHLGNSSHSGNSAGFNYLHTASSGSSGGGLPASAMTAATAGSLTPMATPTLASTTTHTTTGSQSSTAPTIGSSSLTNTASSSSLAAVAAAAVAVASAGGATASAGTPALTAANTAASGTTSTAPTSVAAGGTNSVSSGTGTATAVSTVSSSSFAGMMMASGGGGVVPNHHPFKQRALSIEQIARRHKVEKWTFQQFMEVVFGYSNVGGLPRH